MSTIVMSICWPLQMPSSQKAVLISLADNANDEGVCWPSVDKIMERTCLTDRTVQKCLKWLEERGAISRQKRHHRSTVYTVTPAGYQAWRRDESLPENSSGEGSSGEGFSGEESSGEKNVARPENECASDRKKMSFRPEAASPRTVKEPTKEPSRNRQGAAAPSAPPKTGKTKNSKASGTVSVDQLEAEGVDRQVAEDWLKVRRVKELPLTPTAWEGVKQEARNAGVPVADAVRIAAENSWAGFKASWYEKQKAEAGGAVAGVADDLAFLKSWSGIVAKGNALGLRQDSRELGPHFKERVIKAANLSPEQIARARADFGVNL